MSTKYMPKNKGGRGRGRRGNRQSGSYRGEWNTTERR